MSVIVTIPCQMKSREAIDATCVRLGLPAPRETSYYRTDVAPGLILSINKGGYPCVIVDTATGDVKIDEDYLSDTKSIGLDAFRQTYQIEVARIEARRKGARFQEFPMPDGSVKLRITPR